MSTAPIWVALALALDACGTDVTACPGQEFQATTSSAAAADVQSILAHNCALGGCHLSAPGAGGLVLDMSAPSSWMPALVNVPAQESPTLDLVTPGVPERSWVVRKLFGEFCGTTCTASTGCGGQMPLGSPLAEADRGTIIAWIDAGAPGP